MIYIFGIILYLLVGVLVELVVVIICLIIGSLIWFFQWLGEVTRPWILGKK